MSDAFGPSERARERTCETVAMQGTLVLAILTVKSSYARGIEEELAGAGDLPDTLQWWIGRETTWRIKTFALDHDIHTYSVEGGGSELVELARSNNLRNYGDVLGVQHVLELQDCTDRVEVERAFARIELAPRLEVAAGRFAFWKPDDAAYWSQTEPR